MRLKRFIMSFLIFFVLSVAGAFAFTVTPTGLSPVMRDAKTMLVQSGVAYDASEAWWGKINVQEPKSFFKPTTDQITWWGEFKPFKFWGTPELQAVWINPQGKEAARQDFKGLHCALAKTTLKMNTVARPIPKGKWRVDVYHKGQLIDSKNFMIYGGPTHGSIEVLPSAGEAVPVV